MLPIEPAELSAYLDGELPASRADEIRAALAQDPALRASLDQLAGLDAEWKTRASAAMFRPRVRLGNRRLAPGRVLGAAAAVLVLLMFRVALKSQPPLLGSGVEALLLAVLIGWGLRRIMQATDADRARPVLAAAC